MKKKWFTALAPLLLCPAIFWADTLPVLNEDEGLFLSLTRKGQSEDSLPSQRSVVSREEIERSGARNLGEAMTLVPGAMFDRSGTLGNLTTIRLRGVPNSHQVQILIDDQPIGGTSVQYVDLSQIPVGNIERIEIIRGGSSVLYGANAIGGLINVITRKPKSETPVTNLGVSWGSFNTQVFHGDMGASSEKFEGFLSAERALSDGFQENSDYDGINVSGRGAFKFKHGSSVSLNLTRTDNEVGLPSGTPVPLGEWDGKKEQKANNTTLRATQKTTRANLKAVSALNDWIVVKPSAYLGQSNYLNTPQNQSYDSQSNVNGADLRIELMEGTSLGGSYEHDDFHSNYMEKKNVTNEAVYVQQDVKWGKLKLDPALRMDRHSVYGKTLNPRVGAVCAWSEGMKLSGTVSRSFRAPNFQELYSNFGGNPHLEPETAWGYDVGIEHDLSKGNGYRLTGYYTSIKDLIKSISNQFKNQPNAEITGAEVELFNAVGFSRIRTSYAYVRAVGTSGNKSKHESLALTPRHTASQELTLLLPRAMSVRNGLRYVHKQYTGAGDTGIKAPSFTLWDLSIMKKILSTELTFAIDNITDKHYTESSPEYGYYPLPGRTYRVGVTMRFMD
jgi:outer membrane cobalamin receptor